MGALESGSLDGALPPAAALACGLAATSASADLTDFAMDRCVEPLLAGQIPMTEGLDRVAAKAVGAKGEEMFGTRAKYYWDGSSDYYLAWAEVMETVRACAVNRLPIGASEVPGLKIEGLMAESSVSFGEICRGKGDDGLEMAVAATNERAARGAYVLMGVAGGDLVVFERALPPSACPEEGQ